ncbi:MAG: threonine ammonia-lyase [Chthonomonadetes bacterium]|nr:threonine ammonia-lyase [Chthonomonadetes bacterium]
MVPLERIEEARRAAQGVVQHTPLFPARMLSELTGVPVWLKVESFQRTGSFKIRGAYEFVRRLPAEKRARGVVTGSAGNHAQGVALAAKMFGIQATIFMPVFGSIAKMQAAKAYGAQVILRGEGFAEAVEAAQSFARETGATYVPAYDHDDIICGQGTCGLEILDDLPEVEQIIVPVGGGGLFAGIAAAVKARKPEVRLVGVQSEGADTAVRSWQEGKLVDNPSVRYTLADGIAVKSPSERTFEYIRRYADEMVTVDDRSIARAVLWLLERKKIVAEGAGAAGVAAVQSRKVRPRGATVIVVSGGNIDAKTLSDLIEREMLQANRYYHFFTAVPDRPGGLAALLNLVAQAQGNIMTVNHNRIHPSVPHGWTGVELLVEVRDAEHIGHIERLLRSSGYEITVLV